MTSKISRELVRNLTCALALLCASSVLAQSGTFRRHQKNLAVGASQRRSSSSLTTDNCSGSAQSLNGIGPITWTRGTTATCTKNDGTLVTVSSGQPRCNALGCLVEPTATNYELFSQNFTDASWLKNNESVVATTTQLGIPFFTTTATSTSPGTAVYRTTSGFANATVIVHSAWLKTATGTRAPSVGVQLPTPPTTCVCVRSDGAACTTSTSGNTCISTTTVGTTPVRVAVTTTGTATNSFVSFISSTNWITGGAIGSIDFGNSQVEASSVAIVATSFIPTVGAAVTRNADAPTFTRPAWLTDKQGCFAATATVGFAPTSANLVMLHGGASNYLGYLNSAGPGAGSFDGVNSTVATIPNPISATTTFLGYWSGSSKAVKGNSTTATGAYDGSFFSGTTMYLGTNSSGVESLFGYIRNIKLGGAPTGCP